MRLIHSQKRQSIFCRTEKRKTIDRKLIDFFPIGLGAYYNMDTSNIETQWNKQPFFVINDEGYNRMMDKLQNGERYVKSFPYKCKASCQAECSCPFQINFLKDGRMVRCVDGQLRPVFSVSQYRLLVSAMR